MQAIVGVGGLRSVEGTWEGFAEKSPTEILAIAKVLAKLPKFDWDRDKMAGDTGWLSLGLEGNGLLVYFNGTRTATFEWYPAVSEPAGPFFGSCKVADCLEAIRLFGESPLLTHEHLMAHARDLQIGHSY